MPLIRDAVEGDLPAILAITNAAILETTAVWSVTPATLDTRRAWWMERRALGFPVLVAELDATVVGFGAFGAFRAWEGFSATVEHSLYVDVSAQGRGVGRALLAALTRRARDQGMHVMVAGIEAGNEASLALHRGAGFIETGRMPQVGRKFGRWLDLVLVQKILSDD